VKRRPWLILAVALAAGCGSDDEPPPKGERAPDTATVPNPRAQLLVLHADRIPFTFQYPESLTTRRRPRGRVLAQVGVTPDGNLNAIKVRRTARRELPPDRYLDDFRRDFERAVGGVEQHEEEIAGLEVGVLEFSDSVRRGGRSVDFTSASYFFTGGGGTWQLECIADERHRERIDAACRAALESIRF